jgi:hypothetical protein
MEEQRKFNAERVPTFLFTYLVLRLLFLSTFFSPLTSQRILSTILLLVLSLLSPATPVAVSPEVLRLDPEWAAALQLLFTFRASISRLRPRL